VSLLDLFAAKVYHFFRGDALRIVRQQHHRYGCIDKTHWGNTPGNIISDIREVVDNGGGTLKPIPAEFMDSAYYEATYWVSGDIKEDEILGVALAVYMDWTDRFEGFEGEVFWGIPGLFTAFAIEDKPTHYLNFVAASKHMSIDEMLTSLGISRGTDQDPPRPFPWNVNNHSIHPMTPWLGGLIGGPWRFWPEEVRMNSIGSESGLWQFRSDKTAQSWPRYINWLWNAKAKPFLESKIH